MFEKKKRKVACVRKIISNELSKFIKIIMDFFRVMRTRFFEEMIMVS